MPSKVLLIDDDELVSRVVKRVLGDFAIEWVESKNPPSSEEILKLDWDVLILDLHMPSVSGLKVLESLEQVKPERLQAVLVLSGDRSFEDKAKSFGVKFCSKPIQIDEFQEQISQLLKI